MSSGKEESGEGDEDAELSGGSDGLENRLR